MGRRGGSKGELCAIGGTWEPCDGGHPGADPTALVATAKRTFKDATGVDLSACTQWYVCIFLRADADAAQRTDWSQTTCSTLRSSKWLSIL